MNEMYEDSQSVMRVKYMVIGARDHSIDIYIYIYMIGKLFNIITYFYNVVSIKHRNRRIYVMAINLMKYISWNYVLNN